AVILKEAFVQGTLYHDGVARACGELDQRLVVRRARRRDRQRPGEMGEIMGILQHVEGEALARERAGREFAVERQIEDRVVERCDARRGAGREPHGSSSRQGAWKCCTGPWP